MSALTEVILNSRSFQAIWYLYIDCHFCQLYGLSCLHPFPWRWLQLHQPWPGKSRLINLSPPVLWPPKACVSPLTSAPCWHLELFSLLGQRLLPRDSVLRCRTVDLIGYLKPFQLQYMLPHLLHGLSGGRNGISKYLAAAMFSTGLLLKCSVNASL